MVLADTDEKRTLGLSGSPALEKGLGMLFLFEQEGNYGFWMKDMSYPIDIFWFNAEYQLVHNERNVAPDTFPESFGSEVVSMYVLETNPQILGDISGIQIQK